MAENSKNVNTSQSKTSMFMVFPEKIANQHREAAHGFSERNFVRGVIYVL